MRMIVGGGAAVRREGSPANGRRPWVQCGRRGRTAPAAPLTRADPAAPRCAATRRPACSGSGWEHAARSARASWGRRCGASGARAAQPSPTQPQLNPKQCNPNASKAKLNLKELNPKRFNSAATSKTPKTGSGKSWNGVPSADSSDRKQIQ